MLSRTQHINICSASYTNKLRQCPYVTLLSPFCLFWQLQQYAVSLGTIPKKRQHLIIQSSMEIHCQFASLCYTTEAAFYLQRGSALKTIPTPKPRIGNRSSRHWCPDIRFFQTLGCLIWEWCAFCTPKSLPLEKGKTNPSKTLSRHNQFEVKFT